MTLPTAPPKRACTHPLNMRPSQTYTCSHAHHGRGGRRGMCMAGADAFQQINQDLIGRVGVHGGAQRITQAVHVVN